jgi:hypothetical protein
MHFNIKHIFKGESESEIVKKINYNFDQIISFAVGPDGQGGPKGSLGIPGPAGKKGATGPTGTRSSLFTKQDISPATGDSNPYDYWIDSSSSDYSIYSYGVTGSGSWSFTGYSLFSSPYFNVYDGIVGPGGATDKFAIAFKNGASFLVDNGLSVSDASLIISDGTITSSNGNPNRSKLVIATEDQTSRPILAFAKTGSSNSGIPSFYWTNSGNSTNLSFRSTGDFYISSLLGLTVDSYTASSILNGNSASITSTSDITIGGTGDFFLNTNTTVGVGSNFIVSSGNLTFSSTSFRSSNPVKITNTSQTSGYVFDTTKNSTAFLSYSGVEIYGGSFATKMFEFRDSNNATIFSSSVKGPVQTNNYGQTTFGSTGGLPAGGTAGPYFYHVKRSTEYRQSTYSLFCLGANNIATTSSTLVSGTIRNVFDISNPESFLTDTIIITPTTYESPSTSTVYVRIPSYFASTLPGVYYSNTSCNYRIILNDESGSPTYSLGGLVFTYYNYPSLFNYYFTSDYYVPFNSSSTCYYVDLFFAPAASSTNANPRIFWKTCDGRSGYLTTTNKNTVGTFSASGTTFSGSA